MTITRKCDLTCDVGMSLRVEECARPPHQIAAKIYAKNGDTAGWAYLSWDNVNELHDFLGEWLETHAK